MEPKEIGDAIGAFIYTGGLISMALIVLALYKDMGRFSEFLLKFAITCLCILLGVPVAAIFLGSAATLVSFAIKLLG